MSPQEWASYQFSEQLREEVFFFIYHFKRSRDEALSMPVYDRKWLIRRYINQREEEEEYLQKSMRR